MTSGPGSSRWLAGAAPDLLLGCGAGYALLLAGLALVQPSMAALQPWLPLVVLATGVPHYGATLLRAYGTALARRRYRRVAFHASAAVWLAFLIAGRSAPFGSLLITLYLTWSPWHYSAQNRGLALMFLGRSGVALTSLGRRLVRASFALSVALAQVILHRASQGGGQDPLFSAGPAYHFTPLGLPEPIVAWLVPLLALAFAGCTVALGIQLRRAGARALLPAAAILALQATWFAVPTVLEQLAPTALAAAGAPAAFIWIALAHSVQYLWIAQRFAARSGAAGLGAGGVVAWSGRALLCGAAIWVIPALLFAPGMLGRVPFESGLGLLVAAAVNLHHFVLDGAIGGCASPTSAAC